MPCVGRAAKPGGAPSGFSFSHASTSSFIVCLQNLSQALPRTMQANLGRTDRTAFDICDRRQIELVDVAQRRQAAIGRAQASQPGLKPLPALQRDQLFIRQRPVRRDLQRFDADGRSGP